MNHTPVQLLQDIRTRIEIAALKARRTGDDVQLVAVSKTIDPAAIRPIIAAGQRIFGENRVQEARLKWPTLKTEYPDVELHLIGPLQSNKAGDAVALFDVIQTVDRPKIVHAIKEEMQRQGRRPKIFIQVNTGNEVQKAGISLSEADNFISASQYLLPVHGLMCIPPEFDSPAKHFAILAALAKQHGLINLSMGMSADFEVAIAAGATHVRVGSAIFGTRASPMAIPASRSSGRNG